MNIKNIFAELENAPVDANANIRVIKLTGDARISVFAAEIAPNTRLNPHYHTSGIETYQIVKGSGKMKVGRLINELLTWDEEFSVRTGDCFTIDESHVHQLINDTNEPLLAMFTCPEAHLGNDRFFVN